MRWVRMAKITPWKKGGDIMLASCSKMPPSRIQSFNDRIARMRKASCRRTTFYFPVLVVLRNYRPGGCDSSIYLLCRPTRGTLRFNDILGGLCRSLPHQCVLVLWGRQGNLPPHSRRTTSGLVEGSTRRVTARAGVGARLGAEQRQPVKE